MEDYTQPIDTIIRDFEGEHIPIGQPGFYDHPNFVAVERRNAAYLNNYARYVQARQYEPAYLERARREIPAIAKTFYGEVARSKRLGACVDASMVLSRIMDREGYWNYCVKGSARIDFPPESGIGPQFFWAVDEGNFAAGHAWIFAPPFQVIDVTLGRQPYNRGEERFLPAYVVSESSPMVPVQPTDILSPIVITDLRSKGIAKSDWLATINPMLPRFIEIFPAYSVLRERTEIRYVSVAVSASDSPLDKITSMNFGGRYGIDVYRESIVPVLRQLRGCGDKNGK